MQTDVRDNLVARDHAALVAACDPGVSLCTVVGVEGSFSRAIGAQLAILPDGNVIGDLADGCLENQLVSDIANADAPFVRRYGRGSSVIDFQLPCGGGVDILLDPSPDRIAICRTVDSLEKRQPARLRLPENDFLCERAYNPALRIRVFGEGPEVRMLFALAQAAGVETEIVAKNDLTLRSPSGLREADAFTAVLLLFHDHEWEAALLEEALKSPTFFIGAQGGENARMARSVALMERGVPEEQIARIVSPVGLIANCKRADTLALSAIAQIVERYERAYGTAG
ncbi:XdhC family protein [Erythrobacter litoralis]|uniref:XdhC family protein n=1 Tax=Erythrobacter litoralis TaxID=39960 RepID=UPI002434D6C5|nr:XdhC family protein [Erythrobacter litoralis]